jgi:hypothetical protein
MGYYSQSQCVDTVQAAAGLQCASFPKSAADGATLYTWSCTGASADGASLNLAQTSSAASAPVAQSLAVSFSACDPLQQHKDVGELWGIGLLACTTVWCVKQFILKQVMSNQ